MNWEEEYKTLLWILGFFLFAYWMPVEKFAFKEAIFSGFELIKWYAQKHVLLCLVPAFFIAGVIAVFISQSTVLKYFSVDAKKWISYSIASVSGTILAVCSCTILPLFSGIHKRGAGLGPAIAFLYSGPAINIMAVILTARILGWRLGLARVIGAVTFSIVIGLLMHFIYRKEEAKRAAAQFALPEENGRPFWQTTFLFFVLVFILIFANWGKPDTEQGFWYLIYQWKWMITTLFSVLLALSLIFILRLNKWYVAVAFILVLIAYLIWPKQPAMPFSVAVFSLSVVLSIGDSSARNWMAESWGFAKQILPLLAVGVLIAGFLLGSPDGGEGLISKSWIAGMVGGNSLFANFFASIAGAFMYFATLTEVPILQGLIHAGMGRGPALALLLAGPALSLPNMLVIRRVLGTQKTAVYVFLVVFMATVGGLIYGEI